MSLHLSTQKCIHSQICEPLRAPATCCNGNRYVVFISMTFDFRRTLAAACFVPKRGSGTEVTSGNGTSY